MGINQLFETFSKKRMIIDDYDALRRWQIAFRVRVRRASPFHCEVERSPRRLLNALLKIMRIRRLVTIVFRHGRRGDQDGQVGAPKAFGGRHADRDMAKLACFTLNSGENRPRARRRSEEILISSALRSIERDIA